jgi:hypothetical protein
MALAACGLTVEVRKPSQSIHHVISPARLRRAKGLAALMMDPGSRHGGTDRHAGRRALGPVRRLVRPTPSRPAHLSGSKTDGGIHRGLSTARRHARLVRAASVCVVAGSGIGGRWPGGGGAIVTSAGSARSGWAGRQSTACMRRISLTARRSGSRRRFLWSGEVTGAGTLNGVAGAASLSGWNQTSDLWHI